MRAKENTLRLLAHQWPKINNKSIKNAQTSTKNNTFFFKKMATYNKSPILKIV
tara:strand:+ start:35 stop:193 length:159 start_codon:yes stop_codon:yes gene_type:complete